MCVESYNLVIWAAPLEGVINDLESLLAFLVLELVNRFLKIANICC